MTAIPIKNTAFELGYGQTHSEDLGITPQKLQELQPNIYTDGIYTLQFSVLNAFPSYPGYYTTEISFGTQELGESSGWGTRVPAQLSIAFPCSAYIVVDKSLPNGGPVQGSKNLVLQFTVNDGSVNGGWPIKFSNISLTFTPVS